MAAVTHAPVLIIGAGPAGLVTARSLRERGIAYEQVERHSDVGGLWDVENPGTPMYDSAHFISSKTMSAFAGYPMPDEFPDYPSHRQILAYLRQFAAEYDLTESIRFNTSVTAIEPRDEGSWSVTLSDGSTKLYSGVVCATGTQWEPNIPTFAGSFDGEIRHSVSYRNADDLRGKRVLVVGAGNSGCDIACDIGRAAEQTFLSVRRGYWFIPKHIFGMPSDVFAASGPKLPLAVEQQVFGSMLRVINGDVSRLGLPKPDHKLFETHPILNTEILQRMQHGDVIAKPDIARLEGKEVVFADGTRERVDVIILATGYRHVIPYAQEYFGSEQHPDDLYLSIFSRKYPNLFAMGYIETNSGAYQLFDLASQVLAGYLYDERHDVAQADRFDQLIRAHHPDLSGGIRFVDSPRHKGYVDSTALKQMYLRVLKELHWAVPA